MRALFLLFNTLLVLHLAAQEPPVPTRVPYPTQIEEAAAKMKAEQAAAKAVGPKSVIALGVDLLNRPQQYETDRERGAKTDYIIRLPRFFLMYQREVLSSLAPLQAEVQVRYFRREEEVISNAYIRGSRRWVSIPKSLDENISISTMYIYPGINYLLSSNGEFVTYVGGGLAYALSIESERTADWLDPNSTTPPQLTTNFQESSYGYFLQTGLQARFPTGLGIGVSLRYESLAQKWASDAFEEVLRSNIFWVNEDLAVDRQFMLQCSLIYCW